MRIYTSHFLLREKRVWVISQAVRVEISGLLFFLSKYVMWGRVNKVGHGSVN